MNKQEIFDTVVRHAFAQGGASANEKGMCVYRSDAGRKCFVGALISDEDYRPEMDVEADAKFGNGTGVTNLLYRFPHLPQWMRDEETFLRDLQSAHDGLSMKDDGTFTGLIGDHLYGLALRNKLDTSVLQEAVAKRRGISLEVA